MDELRLRLSTKFMRGIITTLLSKLIRSKFGYDIDIQLNEIEIRTEGGKVCLHADVEAEVSNDEFMKIIKSSGLE